MRYRLTSCLLSQFYLVLILVGGHQFGPALANADEGNRFKAAADLVKIMDFDSELRNSREALIKNHLASEDRLKPYRGLMEAFFREHMSLTSLEQDIVRDLANRLTEPEIRYAIEVYKSPHGKKIMDVLQSFRIDVGNKAYARGAARIDQLNKAIAEEMKKTQPDMRLDPPAVHLPR